MFLVKESYLYI